MLRTTTPGFLAGLLAIALLPAAAAAESYPSYRHLQSDTDAGYTVDELERGVIYDQQGERLAAVRDLVIDRNQQLLGVVLDVPGPFGIDFGVDVDIEPLQLERGADGQLYTGLTREEIEALPEVAERNGRWHVR